MPDILQQNFMNVRVHLETTVINKKQTLLGPLWLFEPPAHY